MEIPTNLNVSPTKLNRCIKIESGGVSFIETDLVAAMAELESELESSDGRQFVVSVVYMSDEELNKLPEFEGF